MGLTQAQLNDVLKANATASTDAYENVRKQRVAGQQASDLQRSDADAKLAQLIKGSELKDQSAIDERDRNLKDLITLRKTAGPDARVTSGDIGYDPRTDVAGRGKAPGPTAFQEQFDKSRATAMAKDIEDGGPVRRAADVGTLQGVEKDLGSRKDISGPVIGSLPMWARSIALPQSAKAQQDFEAIAQRTLKETLGGQFAQKEGEEFFKRAWDPRLPEPLLQKRVAKARQIADMLAQEKQRETDYAQANGTLVGYQGMTPQQATQMFNDALAEFNAEEGGGSAQGGGLDPAKKQRLEELRRKKAAGGF